MKGIIPVLPKNKIELNAKDTETFIELGVVYEEEDDKEPTEGGEKEKDGRETI